MAKEVKALVLEVGIISAESRKASAAALLAAESANKAAEASKMACKEPLPLDGADNETEGNKNPVSPVQKS